ncbi:MAG: hypothetical protein Q8N35_06900 [Methylococcaceae bacterium]|jgi:hypothetical protein|nr:hypothetical protein [Methylococcaceae bacterium]MDZ4157596.1 hypothetical protein [Methylococcales bacterium]MDP2393152.1 hypothetical protein [Methylococcaceae bacterium]MDP3019296.1 hypothetical protein [Methylococcaceae bacterium]MDP3389124.1 hypothetical protein [Methylococcaceae bacterium]
MGITKHIFILSMALSYSANAAVFKCELASGKVIYQASPCPKTAASQNIVEIKLIDPQRAEEAKAKLQAWKEEQAIKEAARNELEKQRKIESDRQESLVLQRRTVIAEEQQALAAQQRQNAIPIEAAPAFNQWYWSNSPYRENNRKPHYSPQPEQILSPPTPDQNHNEAKIGFSGQRHRKPK